MNHELHEIRKMLVKQTQVFFTKKTQHFSIFIIKIFNKRRVKFTQWKCTARTRYRSYWANRQGNQDLWLRPGRIGIHGERRFWNARYNLWLWKRILVFMRYPPFLFRSISFKSIVGRHLCKMYQKIGIALSPFFSG